MHDQRIIVRFDGTQEGLGYDDNLCFTVLSHYVGADGRDFFMSSWIGIDSLLRNTGMNLDLIQIVDRPDSAGTSTACRK